MTKGNWERRAEMSLIRRTEAKEKKASKNDTTKVKPESILHKLQRDEHLNHSGAVVKVFLADPTEFMMCKCYLRRDECRIKKCKLPHDGVTIAHLKNVPYTINSDVHATQESEKACLPPVPLDEVAAKESHRMMFIAIDDTCVFDYLHPDIWHQWSAIHQPSAAASDGNNEGAVSTKKKSHRDVPSTVTSDQLPPLIEETEGNDSNNDDIESESETSSNDELMMERPVVLMNYSSSSTKVFFASENEGKIYSKLFVFLNNEDIISLLTCSKMTKSMCLKDEQVRHRKKEAISLLSHDLSKKKKEEKRKKAKNACISKVDKKDAFARGATIR